jgi:hypothetical protein
MVVVGKQGGRRRTLIGQTFAIGLSLVMVFGLRERTG